MLISFIVVSTILVGVIITAFLIIRNLLKQIEDFEEYTTNSESHIEFLSTWLVTFRRTILNIQQRITEIDIKGSFESDDEVGFAFKEIKKAVSELDELFEVEEEEKTDYAKEKKS